MTRPGSSDPFHGIDVVAEVHARARAVGLDLPGRVADAIVEHARALLVANRTLNLTGLTAPGDVLDRHVGESLAGAAVLAVVTKPAGCDRLLDLGSGNGYPGVPVALALGLRPTLIEATARKAAFLREAIERCCPGGDVVAAHVDRAADVDGLDRVAVLVTRAMGGWEKIVPRLAGGMRPGASVAVWAGEDAEGVVRRAAWRRHLTLVGRHGLPGRQQSWVWHLQRNRD